MPQFIIHDDIFQQFPQTVIGMLVAENLDNTIALEKFESVLQRAEEHTRTLFANQALSEHPSIHAWRQAYKQFKAGDYRCSAENLAKRIIKGNHLPQINPLVDLYNAISLLYTVPVGGEDLMKVHGNIMLTNATGSENFIALGTIENNPPEPGEIVYKDDATVLCRKWNWRESDHTKLTPQTTKAIFFIEDLCNEEPLVEKALEEFATLLQTYCGATTTFNLLDAQHTIATL